MDTTTNGLNWFEIPASDLQRAKHFYQTLFSIHMDEADMLGQLMAFFPYENGSGKVGGALVQSEFHHPSNTGSVVYLNANPSMGGILNMVESEGGKILMPKTSIGEGMGFMAFIEDTEGNKVGLHSQN